MLSDDVGILITQLITIGFPATQASTQLSTSRVVSHTQSSASGLTPSQQSSTSLLLEGNALAFLSKLFKQDLSDYLVDVLNLHHKIKHSLT